VPGYDRRGMADRRRRSPARFLAPLALAVVIAGIYVVVHKDLPKSKQPSGTVQTGHTTTGTGTGTGAGSPPARTHTSGTHVTVKYYVVKAGDNLDLIAQRTGVSVARIEALNPGLSATALRVGQRLTLRR
jgi:LysM repeat protein